MSNIDDDYFGIGQKPRPRELERIMACEVHNSVANFTLPAASNYRCIYVGKGPSCVEVEPYVDWGDLASVNNASDLECLSGKYNQVCFCDGFEYAKRVAHHRSGMIIIPHIKISDASECPTILVHWPHSGSMSRSSLTEHIEARTAAYFGTPGVSGVITLWLMGYTSIMLFGHDGGMGVLDGFDDTNTDYSNRREAIEFMIPLLAERGCEVKLWPDKFDSM